MEKTVDASFRVRAATEVRARRSGGADSLQPDDSAFCVMTDFEREYPHTITDTESLADALACMVRVGEQSLLVVRPDPAGSDPQVVGLLTLFDIYRIENTCCANASKVQAHDHRVDDVMTPWNELPLVKYESLQLLAAQDLVDLFQGTKRTHLLVIDKAEQGDGAVARGLISRGTLAKRLRRGRQG